MKMIEPSFGAAILLVNGLIELVKMTGLKKLKRFYPLIAEAFGFVIGIGIGIDWFVSLFIGLTAMGFYDLALNPIRDRLVK
jgi:hypothetical protein